MVREQRDKAKADERSRDLSQRVEADAAQLTRYASAAFRARPGTSAIPAGLSQRADTTTWAPAHHNFERVDLF